MQILKLPISSSSNENNVEDFTSKHPLLSEKCTSEICEKFVYKHSKTTEYVKNKPTFLRKLQTSRVNNSLIIKENTDGDFV